MDADCPCLKLVSWISEPSHLHSLRPDLLCSLCFWCWHIRFLISVYLCLTYIIVLYKFPRVSSVEGLAGRRVYLTFLNFWEKKQFFFSAGNSSIFVWTFRSWKCVELIIAKNLWMCTLGDGGDHILQSNLFWWSSGIISQSVDWESETIIDFVNKVLESHFSATVATSISILLLEVVIWFGPFSSVLSTSNTISYFLATNHRFIIAHKFFMLEKK